VVFEPAGAAVSAQARAAGDAIAQRLTEGNRIPAAVLEADPAGEGWLAEARAAVDGLLAAARG